MTPLPRLHWSTLGEPTRELEHRWAGSWEVSLDRGPAPALPPRDTDLWVINAAGEPAPGLARLCAEAGALPILLLLDPGRRPASPQSLASWGQLGSLRWGLLPGQPRPCPACARPRPAQVPALRLPVPGPGPGGHRPGHARGPGQGPGRRGHPGHRPAAGRKRHRQGGHRPGHPPHERPARPALRPGPLRRHPGQPHRVRAVRLHQGRLHRRPQGRPRQVPGGPRRDHLPGRGEHHAPRASRCACCGCCRSGRCSPWAAAPR